ncbi:MAG TPA: hypothetical protein VJK53_03225 [Candidatus Paceibacterota bacterium]
MTRTQIIIGISLAAFVAVVIFNGRFISQVPETIQPQPVSAVEKDAVRDQRAANGCPELNDTYDSWHSNKSLCPAGKIDEHLTINNIYREVTFCGHTFKTPQVVIDGVDVIQRLAELANTEKRSPGQAEGQDMPPTCFNIVFNNPEQGPDAVLNVLSAGGEFPSYQVQISATSYDIDLSDGTVYDFSFLGRFPLGSLK